MSCLSANQLQPYSEHNSIARLQNSGAARNDHRLTVLHDYATNTNIQGFPTTPAQIDHMTSAQLNPILTALDLPTNGTVQAKRRRLKFYIGLKSV
jgi:hypothetical protein